MYADSAAALCMYVCMYVCMCVYMNEMCMQIHQQLYVCLYVCMYVCMYVILIHDIRTDTCTRFFSLNLSICLRKFSAFGETNVGAKLALIHVQGVSHLICQSVCANLERQTLGRNSH